MVRPGVSRTRSEKPAAVSSVAPAVPFVPAPIRPPFIARPLTPEFL
jgi:hypothetical protein